MSKLRFLTICTIVLFVASFVGGCTNDSVSSNYCVIDVRTTDQLQTRSGTVPTEDFLKMSLMGIDTTAVQVYDDYYIAEGCYYILRADLLNLSLEEASKLSVSDAINSHAQRLFYEIDTNNINPTQEIYVIQGVLNWNDISDCGLDIECERKGIIENKSPNRRYCVQIVFEKMGQSEPLLVCDVSDGLPARAIRVNTNNHLWNYVQANYLTLQNFIMHAVGESLGINSIDSYYDAFGSIMADETLLETYNDNLWNGLIASDLAYIRQFFPETTHNLTCQWNPAAELHRDGYLLNVGDHYKLTLSSPCPDCQASDNLQYVVEVEGVTNPNATFAVECVNPTNGEFELTFSEAGEYLVTMSVTDKVNSQQIDQLHKQTFTIYVVENRIEYTPLNNVMLNFPYVITYKYWHPEYKNPTFEFYAEELLFDNNSDTYVRLTTQGNECSVRLLQNGCYFVTCIVKDGEEEIERKYCNITRMPLPDSLEMRRTIADTSIYRPNCTPHVPSNAILYDYDMMLSNTITGGRVHYLVEYEVEYQESEFNPPCPVEKNRSFNLGYLKLSTNSLLDTYHMPRTGWWMIEQTSDLDFKGFLQYYTGYMYSHSTGIREVDGVSLEFVPMRVLRDPVIEGHTPDIMRSRTPSFIIE